ncbi:MAG: 2-C-methyl-D-erythritol 4-phosphate cytidylyltransferase [Bacteroidaceae bacterium]|nr:2-C-methyl-D-erythritol 4-phosphate cytidylyltransferase [Bacteroidaceae bacterium]
MKKAVIIVAGGKGLRMGSDIPKQFLPIGGKPILMHTIEVFHRFDPDMQIVVVLPLTQQEYWRTICKDCFFNIPVIVANGGETRFHSVKNGLEKIDADIELIGVHDGVRPFVTTEVIGRCYTKAMSFGAAMPVVDVVDTLRQLPDKEQNSDVILHSTTVPRNQYKLVQTPQVFSAELLRQAYKQDYEEGFTDDASVVENMGHDVALVPGNRENIKVTTQFDLVVGEAVNKNITH